MALPSFRSLGMSHGPRVKELRRRPKPQSIGDESRSNCVGQTYLSVARRCRRELRESGQSDWIGQPTSGALFRHESPSRSSHNQPRAGRLVIAETLGVGIVVPTHSQPAASKDPDCPALGSCHPRMLDPGLVRALSAPRSSASAGATGARARRSARPGEPGRRGGADRRSACPSAARASRARSAPSRRGATTG